MYGSVPARSVRRGFAHRRALGLLALAAAGGAVALGLVLTSGGAARSAGARAVRAVRAVRNASGAQSVSSNWAGYAVTSTGTTYTSVTATWTQPKVTCDASDAGTESAFWVGLGGYSSGSQALEQVGADSDCSTVAQPSYYAWVCVPSAAVELRSKSSPATR